NLLNISLRHISIDQFVTAWDPGHTSGFGWIDGNIYTLSAPKTRQLAQIASEATYVPPPSTRPATAGATSPTTAPATSLATGDQMDVLQRLLRTTTVDGTVRISQSDLGNFGPISFLYNAMHLGGNMRVPTGHGTIALHMEQGTLHIPNLYYFNRGIEVRGVATATQMWNLPDNPIEGSAVGTARPLKNIKLPLFAEADAILSGLQGQLTSIQFKGTVKDPKKDYIRQLGLTQMGSELRQLLLGEVGANRGQ
ncbi:MAG TPA: hypothetical protein VN541_15335, partial [Tepidisphaeraceae bacterium]|nr:hypothetical protein [Tepidisphaeraceae bacterium]